MTAPADLLVVHAAELATLATGSVPRRGAALADPGIVSDGAVAAAGGRIMAVGPTEAVLRSVSRTPATTTVDASGRLVTPGLVDPHTHLVFAGHRAHEFTMRLHGAGYAEILARSEERRVGKECRSRWSPYDEKRKEKKKSIGNVYQ